MKGELLVSNIVIFGSTQSGKTTLLGYLSTGMLRNPQFNEEVLKNLKFIRNITIDDEFNIGNPYKPTEVNKDVILPSFVSLDKNELKKFTNQNTEGTTKRIHHKQLTICMSERDDKKINQNENENVTCTFVDVPGFRQRLSDKYRGFFEGDIGIAVLKLSELVALYELVNKSSTSEIMNEIDAYEGRLFEPIRVWCDYRSPSRLVIVVSQIDQSLKKGLIFGEEQAKTLQRIDISKAIECIKMFVKEYNRGIDIPISPISIRITSEPNIKEHHRMSVFFRREAVNIYESGDKLPGSGTLISCLKKIMPLTVDNNNRLFSMASVNKVMKTVVDGSPKTVLDIHALHGVIRKSDKIWMGPIMDKQYNEIVFAQCEIASLKADGAAAPSEILLEGNIGGIIFKHIQGAENACKYNLSHISGESNISILKSTILFSGKVLKGDIVELEINECDYININGVVDEIYCRVLPSIMPFDQVYLFWYGKKVAVNIVEIIFENNKLRLSAIVSNVEKKSFGQFAVPCDEKDVIKHKDNVLLAIPRQYYSTMPLHQVQGKYTYISCNIFGLKDSLDFNSVNIEAPNSMCLCTILSDNVHFEHRTYKSELDIIDIPIRDSRKKIDIHSVLKKVGQNIKKCYNRQGYQRYGGVRMMLLKDNALLIDRDKTQSE